MCRSLTSEGGRMGPRRKASKIQPFVGGGEGEAVPRTTEPKDYINELSHEVLCHIFRYTVCGLHTIVGQRGLLCIYVLSVVVIIVC